MFCNPKLFYIILIFSTTINCGIQIAQKRNGSKSVYIEGLKVLEIESEVLINESHITTKMALMRWIFNYITKECEFFMVQSLAENTRLVPLARASKLNSLKNATTDLLFTFTKDGDNSTYMASQIDSREGLWKIKTEGHIATIINNLGGPWKIKSAESSFKLREHALVRKLKVIIYPSFFLELGYESLRLVNPADIEYNFMHYILLITPFDCIYEAMQYEIDQSIYNILSDRYALEHNKKILETLGLSKGYPSIKETAKNIQIEIAEYSLSMLISVILIIYYMLSFIYPSILFISRTNTLFIIYNVITFELSMRLIFKNSSLSQIMNKAKDKPIIMLIIIIVMVIKNCASHHINMSMTTVLLIGLHYLKKIFIIVTNTINVNNILFSFLIQFSVIFIMIAAWLPFPLLIMPLFYVILLPCSYFADYLSFIYLLRAMNSVDTIIIMTMQIMIFNITNSLFIILSTMRIMEHFLFIDLYNKLKTYNPGNIKYESGEKTIFYLRLLFISCKYAILLYIINTEITAIYIIILMLCIMHDINNDAIENIIELYNKDKNLLYIPIGIMYFIILIFITLASESIKNVLI